MPLSAPIGEEATSSTRLQVETMMPSSTALWSTRVESASVMSDSLNASRSRISTGAVLWLNPMRTMFIATTPSPERVEQAEVTNAYEAANDDEETHDRGQRRRAPAPARV